MSRFGFIHDELEIKILILFILNRLPTAVDKEMLADLVLCDDGISYFDYAQCLSELVDTGHVELEEGLYYITEKGRRNGRITESSIPYSVRLKSEKSTMKASEFLKRSEMIHASHEPREGGGYSVYLSLADGLEEIISLRLFAGSERQANALEYNFRRDAEAIYGRIVKDILET